MSARNVFAEMLSSPSPVSRKSLNTGVFSILEEDEASTHTAENEENESRHANVRPDSSKSLHKSLSNIKQLPSATPTSSARADIPETLAVINDACTSSQSINTALNNVRSAKAMAAARRRAATTKIKADRAAEKEDSMAFNKERETMKQQLLKLRGDMGMEMIKHRAADAQERKNKKVR